LFSLNDPTANIYYPYENEIMTSVIFINENGQRMANMENYTVNIDAYNLSNDVDGPSVEKNMHLFFVPQDKKIICRLVFSNVTGIHTVSVLWYKPNSEFFDMTENALWTPEGEENDPITLWFWIDALEQKLTEGRWSIKIFIDGQYIFEDWFDVDLTYDIINSISEFDTKSLDALVLLDNASDITESADLAFDAKSILESIEVTDIEKNNGEMGQELRNGTPETNDIDELSHFPGKTGKSKSTSGNLSEILESIYYNINVPEFPSEAPEKDSGSETSNEVGLIEFEEMQTSIINEDFPPEPCEEVPDGDIQPVSEDIIIDIFDSIELVPEKPEEKKEKSSDDKLPEF
jgi:hypothetical protein